MNTRHKNDLFYFIYIYIILYILYHGRVYTFIILIKSPEDIKQYKTPKLKGQAFWLLKWIISSFQIFLYILTFSRFFS